VGSPGHEREGREFILRRVGVFRQHDVAHTQPAVTDAVAGASGPAGPAVAVSIFVP
jgi:hypothetical protein